jgi:hypothetical protein
MKPCAIDVFLIVVILLCLWGIVSHRVRTGVLATLGLTLIAAGCAAALDDYSLLARAFRIVVIGAALLGVSVFGTYLRGRYDVRPREERRHFKWPTI